MNRTILIGNLVRDVELTETPNGTAVAKFSIAVSRDYANADGTRETDFFNITVWRGRAETCAKYLQKGSKVAIVGSLQNRSYEDKDGIKRTITEIVASEVEFLTPKSAQGNGEQVVTAKRERPQLEEIDASQMELPF